MLEQNKQNKLSDENILNIRTNIKNLISNENNLKRAIKYVAEYNRNNSIERYNIRNLEKSASPLGRRQRYKYKDFNQTTAPIRQVLNITRDPLFKSIDIKYNNTSINDIPRNINKNKDEFNEIEISSINENGMPKSKSPDKNNIENNDDDINELITTIEDLQSIINGQKYEIKNIKKENKKKR